MSKPKHPTKAERNALIAAYAQKIYSARLNANFKTQQRLHDLFEARCDKLSDRYPAYDFTSSAFWAGLEADATKWWVSRANRGPGQNW